MKGTILDFLKLAAEKPELAQELVELAARHGFEFTDEVSDEDLENVAGGSIADYVSESAKSGAKSALEAFKRTVSLIDSVSERDTQETRDTPRI
jgi:hypothetical protein